MNISSLRKSIKRNEGKKLFPYEDTVGKITIGYGRNLTDNGISENEADYLLDNDIASAVNEARIRVPCWPFLSEARKEVVAEMIFNMGWPRFSTFVKFLAALERQDYEDAANEMMDSRWAIQVGARAERLKQKVLQGDIEETQA